MTTPSEELNEILNHEDFILLWIPSNDAPDEFKKLVPHLSELYSIETGLNYINQLKSHSKIFLVLKNFESLIHFENLSQIQSIYIFKTEDEHMQFNTKVRPKLSGIFEDVTELIDRLRKDVLLTYRSDLPISISSIKEIKIEQSLTNLHENTLMFLWDQLFIYYLIKSPNINKSKLKSDMIEQCKLEYQDDQLELRRINEFYETCSSENAFKWYTRDSFLYRLFNKAFRTRSTELICKFQYFVILLHENFLSLSKKQKNNPSVVYRGLILDKKTIEKLKSNEGHLISMNTILSTSCDERTAHQFIYGAENAVIFKISLPNKSYDTFNKPFVDISDFSSMPHEQEVLFFIGTVFLIHSVEQNPDNSIWTIELTLHNEITQQIENLASTFHTCIPLIKLLHHSFMKTDDFNMINEYYWILTHSVFSSKTSPVMMMCIRFAFTLSNFGLYGKAIELYEQAILTNNISIHSPESIVIHLIIGYLYYHSSKYNDALISYGIVLSLIDEENLLACELYSHIGDLWNRIGNENKAFSCYEKALEIANYRDFPSLPNLYRNMISIFKKQQNFDEVCFYGNQAEEIDQTRYHISESTFHDQTLLERDKAELLNNNDLTSVERMDLLYRIGLRLIVKGDFDQALGKLLEAKKLVLETPPPWNRFPRRLSTLFDNIASLYLYFGDYLKALTNWKQGINIRRSFSAQ